MSDLSEAVLQKFVEAVSWVKDDPVSSLIRDLAAVSRALLAAREQAEKVHAAAVEAGFADAESLAHPEQVICALVATVGAREREVLAAREEIAQIRAVLNLHPNSTHEHLIHVAMRAFHELARKEALHG